MKVAPRANWNFLVSNEDRRLRNECVKWKNSSAIFQRKIDIHILCKNYGIARTVNEQTINGKSR